MLKRSALAALAVLVTFGGVACTKDDSASTSTAVPASATTLPAAEAQSVGEGLVKDYYGNLSCSSKDAEAYAALLDDSFVSVTATGVKDKATVLKLLADTCFTSATTADVKVTQTPGQMVVTYTGKVDVEGAPAATATQRVNVFVDEGGTWKGVLFADAGTPPA